MKINEILTEGQLEEINWRKGLATAALGAAALNGMGGATAADAQPVQSPAQVALEPSADVKAFVDDLMKKPLVGMDAVKALAPLKSPELMRAAVEIVKKNPRGDVRLELAQAIENLYQADLEKIGKMKFK